MTSSSRILYLNDQPIAAKYVEQLDHRRITVHRFELEPGSFRYTIPPSVTTIIVKQRKEDWEDEFEVEIKAYERMKDVQGRLIPQLYGQGSFEGVPALILSDVPGITLFELAWRSVDIKDELAPPRVDIKDEVLADAIREAFRELHGQGCEYWDEKLDNAMFCKDGKVVIIDLENVKFPEQPDPWEKCLNRVTARSLMDEFLSKKQRLEKKASAGFLWRGPHGWVNGAWFANWPCRVGETENVQGPNFAA